MNQKRSNMLCSEDTIFVQKKVSGIEIIFIWTLETRNCFWSEATLFLADIEKSRNLFIFTVDKAFFLLRFRCTSTQELLIRSHGYYISEFDDLLVKLYHSCHKIKSSLYENCIDKLFNVRNSIKEKKRLSSAESRLSDSSKSFRP